MSDYWRNVQRSIENDRNVQVGIGDAFAEWATTFPISMRDAVAFGVREAVTSYMESHPSVAEDAIRDAVTAWLESQDLSDLAPIDYAASPSANSEGEKT